MTIAYLALAVLAGIAAFASPCCLPLVPAYVSYMVGTTPADSPGVRRVAFKQALVFVLGFTVVFVALFASFGLLGYVASGLQPAPHESSVLLFVPVDPIQNTACVLVGFALVNARNEVGPAVTLTARKLSRRGSPTGRPG